MNTKIASRQLACPETTIDMQFYIDWTAPRCDRIDVEQETEQHAQQTVFWTAPSSPARRQTVMDFAAILGLIAGSPGKQVCRAIRPPLSSERSISASEADKMMKLANLWRLGGGGGGGGGPQCSGLNKQVRKTYLNSIKVIGFQWRCATVLLDR